MICLRRAKIFCKDDISLIENFEKAIYDSTQTWHCHHRRENISSRKELIKIGEYYNRPANELIFLTKSEHRAIHASLMFKGKTTWNKGGKLSEETKQKMSEALKGKNTWIKGLHWFNNGIITVRAKSCPEGFVRGRIKLKKYEKRQQQ